jgi:hypothetical protein
MPTRRPSARRSIASSVCNRPLRLRCSCLPLRRFRFSSRSLAITFVTAAANTPAGRTMALPLFEPGTGLAVFGGVKLRLN